MLPILLLRSLSALTFPLAPSQACSDILLLVHDPTSASASSVAVDEKTHASKAMFAAKLLPNPTLDAVLFARAAVVQSPRALVSSAESLPPSARVCNAGKTLQGRVRIEWSVTVARRDSMSAGVGAADLCWRVGAATTREVVRRAEMARVE
jgi:hypothetical protein